MANITISAMPGLGTGAAPGDLLTVVDISAPAASANKHVTLNNLLSTITRGITDHTVRFTAPGSPPAVSGPNEGGIYFDGSAFQLSANGGAYSPLATAAGSAGDYQINSGSGFAAGVLAQSAGRLTATPTAATSGVAPYLRIRTPADTGLTASTEAPGIVFGGDASGSTVTRTRAAGATTLQREYIFTAPTYAAASATTITTAATVAITGAPVAGTNATLTNRFALLVDGKVGWRESVASQPTGTPSYVEMGTSSTSDGFVYNYLYQNAPFAIVKPWDGSGSSTQNLYLSIGTDLGRTPAAVLSCTFNSAGNANVTLTGTSSTGGVAPDLILSASPYRYGGATDKVGRDVYIQSGIGTGTGVAGRIFLQFARASAGALSDEWRATYSTDAVNWFANLRTSTTSLTEAARFSSLWTTNTHASRSAASTIAIVDNAQTIREIFRFAGNGSNTGTVLTQTVTSGATSVFGQLEENLTLSTVGATTDTTIQIPANSLVLGVTVRVTTEITGIDSTALDIGDSTTAARFGSIAAFTAGTTGVGLNALQGGISTDAAGPIVTSATAVRLTLAGGADNTPSAGAVRVTIHYISVTAPTS